MGTWRPSDHSRSQKGGTLFEVPEQEDLSPRDRVGARTRRGGGARDGTSRVRRPPITSFTPTCGVRRDRGHHHRYRLQHPAMTDVTVQWDVLAGDGLRRRMTPRSRRPCLPVPRRAPIIVETPAADTASTCETSSPLPQGCRRSRRSHLRAVRSERVVAITGTNFGCTTSVMFNTTARHDLRRRTRRRQITATVPTGATTGPIHVTTSGGGPPRTARPTSPWSRDPTITSFTPTSGSVGHERHDHRHEPHRCDRGQVQRDHGDVHDEHRHLGDRDRSVGCDDRQDHGHDSGWDGDQRHRLHGDDGADGHEAQPVGDPQAQGATDRERDRQGQRWVQRLSVRM